jgi:hypothetical protein
MLDCSHHNLDHVLNRCECYPNVWPRRHNGSAIRQIPWRAEELDVLGRRVRIAHIIQEQARLEEAVLQHLPGVSSLDGGGFGRAQ